MRPRILFVVMSAVSRPETVDQLAASLAPHEVLVHHDFSQTPHFPLTSVNVRFVPQPRRTGWASFTFVEGIFHSLAYALENLEFDYLQLLSPTCLPLRPIAEFESVVTHGADAHFGAIDVMADRDCLMSVGYRAFAPAHSVPHRLLRRLCQGYFGSSQQRRDEAGVWLRSGGGDGLQALIARRLVAMFSRRWLHTHPQLAGWRPYYGSVWFGARRNVVQDMVDTYRQPGVREYFSRLCMAEEFLIPTLLMHLARSKGPLLHYVSKFDEAHPRPIDEAQLEAMHSSHAYFGRKFPDDPGAAVRLYVLDKLAGAGARQRGRQGAAEPVVSPTEVPLPEPIPVRTAEPVPALAAGAAAVLGLHHGWQSFAGAGRRLRH